MARRGNIAALGALAALGAGILENKRNKDKEKVPVEDLSNAGTSKAKSSFEEENVFTGPMTAAKKTATKTAAPKAESTVKKGKDSAADLIRQANEADAFYNPRRSGDDLRGKGEGEATSRNFVSRRTQPEGAPKQTTSAAPTKAAAPSGDLASQIPGSAPAGWQGGSGERVDSTELGRNVSNTMSALGAATGAGALGPALRSASNLGMYSRAAQPASRTEQLADNATRQLTGPSKSDLVARDRAARATARQEEMLAENARRSGLNRESPGYEGAARAVRENLGEGNWVLRKKGGSVKSTPAKPAAKGWGKARGARQAKYY